MRTRGDLVAGHAALAGVQVAFGLFPIFGTLAFAPGGFSPLGVGSWRMSFGALVLGALSFAAYGRTAFPQRRDLSLFFVCAFLGVVINQGLFLIGLSRSTPMNAGLVMSLIPIFTFAVAAGIRLEPFSPVRGFGILLALAGALLLLIGGEDGLIDKHTIGNALMVVNALSYSIYLVVSKRLLERYPPLLVIAWVYIFSLAALPVFAVGERLLPDPGFSRAWWSLAYILAFPTVIAYLLNMFALKRVRATTTAVYVYAQPLVAGIAAWIVFGERPTPSLALSAVLLFLGIWLVGRRSPAPAARRAGLSSEGEAPTR